MFGMAEFWVSDFESKSMLSQTSGTFGFLASHPKKWSLTLANIKDSDLITSLLTKIYQKWCSNQSKFTFQKKLNFDVCNVRSLWTICQFKFLRGNLAVTDFLIHRIIPTLDTAKILICTVCFWAFWWGNTCPDLKLSLQKFSTWTQYSKRFGNFSFFSCTVLCNSQQLVSDWRENLTQSIFCFDVPNFVLAGRLQAVEKPPTQQLKR